MTLEEAKRYLLRRARELGLQAEVLFQEERELSLRARQGTLEEIKEARQGGVGLRVQVQGRLGYAYTEELSQEALEWALSEARDNALLAGKEGLIPPGQALGSHDLLGEGLSAPLETKRQSALALEGALWEDPRTRSVLMGGYMEKEVRVALASTLGTEGAFRTGLAGMGGSLVMADGPSLKQGWDFKLAKEFHALEPGRTALEIREKTARLLNAKPLPTGRYRAYLEPKAMAGLLFVLSRSLSAKSALEGKSRLVNRLGDRIASEWFTLVDDPTLEKGLLSRPFDVEGTPARRTVVVDKGILKTFLHNAETARALRQENTGHAFRTYRGVLDVAPTNLYLEPVGNLRLEKGVLITEFMGLHAGANPVSLDFSLQALGLWVEDGEVRYAVENFAVAGNLLELLQAIEAVGDELDWEVMGSAFGSPTVAVAELSFGGN